jgi:hypothetical protein
LLADARRIRTLFGQVFPNGFGQPAERAPPNQARNAAVKELPEHVENQAALAQSFLPKFDEILTQVADRPCPESW